MLFPIGSTGILGEIPWNRTSFAEAMTTQVRHHEPPSEELMGTVDLLEDVLSAWRSGDEKNVIDLLEDDCALAIRNYADPESSLCVATGKDDVGSA